MVFSSNERSAMGTHAQSAMHKLEGSIAGLVIMMWVVSAAC